MAESREVIEEGQEVTGEDTMEEGPYEIREASWPERSTGTVLMEGEQSKEGKRSV